MSLAPSLKLTNLGNNCLPYLRLTVNIFQFLRLSTKFLAAFLLWVKPIQTLSHRFAFRRSLIGYKLMTWRLHFLSSALTSSYPRFPWCHLLSLPLLLNLLSVSVIWVRGLTIICLWILMLSKFVVKFSVAGLYTIRHDNKVSLWRINYHSGSRLCHVASWLLQFSSVWHT